MGVTRVQKGKAIPIWERVTISIEEAAAYSGIGRDKIRSLTEEEDCDYVLWVGKRRMIKRVKFEEYLNNSYSI